MTSADLFEAPDPVQTMAIIREMLATGEIHESDRWHARQIVDDPDTATPTNIRWLKTVIDRGGARFKHT